MLRAYIGKLWELAEIDERIVHLLADSGTGYDELFRRGFPGQMFNFGIAEENMVAAAAGMATCGKTPFVYTAGAFLCYRSLEFVRDDICLPNLNVKLVGMGSGLAWSSLGPTHHTTEDIAVLRALPNLLILSPATPNQVSAAVEAAYRHNGPVYLRIGINNEKEFFEEGVPLEIGDNDVLFEGDESVVFTTGSILEEVYNAVAMLRREGKSVGLINVTTIKPFNYAAACRSIKGKKQAIVVEEHSIYGGLSGIIAETIALNALGVPLSVIGLEDQFAVGYGTVQAVRKANGLDAESLYSRLKKAKRHEQLYVG